MKLIDDKGRILGKINIIDLVIIILFLLIGIVILLISAGELSVDLTNNRNNRISVQSQKQVSIVVYNQRKFIIEAINVGDIETQNGKIIAKITDKNTELVGSRNKIYDVTVTINMTTEEKENKLYYKNYELKIGQVIGLDFSKVKITGTVKKIK